MVIAVDLDGVVFDTEEYYRTYAHLYDIHFYQNGLKNKKEMNVFDRYGWTQKMANEFYEEYTEKVLSQAPIKPGAKYVLKELKKKGHKLVCITLRGFYRQCEIDITEKRLIEENIVFDKIIYSQQNKFDACKQENVSLIIDDNPHIIESLSKKGITCFHFKGAGLRKVEHQNAIEVQNWAEIFENILKIEN